MALLDLPKPGGLTETSGKLAAGVGWGRGMCRYSAWTLHHNVASHGWGRYRQIGAQLPCDICPEPVMSCYLIVDIGSLTDEDGGSRRLSKTESPSWQKKVFTYRSCITMRR
ncbi:hypothetical protein J6590_008823 [Homalodisca vitripennis]|nr:hypothetical protein J6590_008823 [Homalodisca vitripennis]